MALNPSERKELDDLKATVTNLQNVTDPAFIAELERRLLTGVFRFGEPTTAPLGEAAETVRPVVNKVGAVIGYLRFYPLAD